MLFTYCIVPKGGREADALAQGNLSAPNLHTAKHYVQTVNPPNVRGHKESVVILTDAQGKEIWRGPYNSPGA